MGWLDFIAEKALYYGVGYAMSKSDKVDKFVNKQVDKNNKYIDDLSDIQERRDFSSKSVEELKELYNKTNDSKLKNAIKKELIERGY